jgi:hypothetical protein
VRRPQTILILTILVFTLGCGQWVPKPNKCFDDIRDRVKGRTAAEIESLLGEPDSRQLMPMIGERWVWWNYTYLDGKNYPPELRGKVVHLEIIFERTSNAAAGGAKMTLSDLKVIDPLSVSYTIPQHAL